MAEKEVYLSIFSRETGQRKTSFTIIGEVHGKTIDDLKKKAATEYPDDYAVAQTQKVYHAVVEGDLHFDGTDYIDPPQPTAEELQAQTLATLDAEYKSKFDDLDGQIVKAAALKNETMQDELIAERAALVDEYTQKRGEL